MNSLYQFCINSINMAVIQHRNANVMLSESNKCSDPTLADKLMLFIGLQDEKMSFSNWGIVSDTLTGCIHYKNDYMNFRYSNMLLNL